MGENQNLQNDSLKIDTMQQISNFTSEYRKTSPLCSSSYNSTANRSNISDSLGTKGYLIEFQRLESEFQRSHDSEFYLEFYQSLFNVVEQHITKNRNDFELLNYLRIAILSRIFSMKNKQDVDFVIINVDTYYGIIKEELNRYKRVLKEVTIFTNRFVYLSITTKKIDEAEKIIQESISPEMNKIYDDTKSQIHFLINETIELEKQEREKAIELKEKRSQLQNQLRVLALMGMLKTGVAFLSLASPKGAVPSAALAESGLNKNTLGVTKTVAAQFANYYKQEQAILKYNLDLDKVNATKQLYNISNDENFKNISKKVDRLKELLNQPFVMENVFFEEKTCTKNELIKYRDELSKKQKDIQVGMANDKVKSEKKKLDVDNEQKLLWVNKMVNFITFAEIGIQAKIDYNAKEDGISRMSESIEKVEVELGNMKKYEEDLRNIISPMVKTIRMELSKELNKLSDLFQVTLDTNKWKLQCFLKRYKANMERQIQTSNPAIKVEIMGCIDKLHDGISTLFHILYDRIQEYQSQDKLAKYIAEINSGPALSRDPELEKELHNLEVTTKSNLVLHEYEKLVSTFIQYMFPFAKYYVQYYDLSPHLQSRNVSDLVTHAGKQIDSLRSEFKKISTTNPNQYDHVFSKVRFNMEHFDQGPFYKWEYHIHKQNISRLLQGQQVTLKADITKTLALNAVKFNEIGIRFVLANKTLQNEFDQQTNKLFLTLEHRGDSYYRCDNNYYIFDHPSIRIAHSMNFENDPTHLESVDYAKIRENTAVFSPYATWNIKLEKRERMRIEDEDPNPFDELQKFYNQEIDVALEGKGSFLNPHATVCDENLDKYYKRLDERSLSRRRRTTSISGQAVPFTSSSANQVKSPLTTAMNSLRGFMTQMKLFHAPNVINYDCLKKGIQYILNEVKQISIFTNPNFASARPNSSFMSTTTFNINESLILADFFVRWVNKTKGYGKFVEQPMNLLQARALALNITTNFEEILQRDYPNKFLDFDPILLMSKLEKEIINRNNLAEIEKILHQSIN